MAEVKTKPKKKKAIPAKSGQIFFWGGEQQVKINSKAYEDFFQAAMVQGNWIRVGSDFAFLSARSMHNSLAWLEMRKIAV